MNIDRVSKMVSNFANAIAGTPVSNRRNGIQNRTSSLRMRGLALGFLLGVAASVGLWIYDKRGSRPAAA